MVVRGSGIAVLARIVAGLLVAMEGSAERGFDAPPILTCDFIYCDKDADRGEELATRYLGTYLASLLHHY